MLNNILGEASRIAIGGHVRPDGDCVAPAWGFISTLRRIIKTGA